MLKRIILKWIAILFVLMIVGYLGFSLSTENTKADNATITQKKTPREWTAALIKKIKADQSKNTSDNATSIKIDLANPDMGKVYTVEVSKDYDPSKQSGLRQTVWVFINKKPYPVAIENISNPQIMCGLKKGQWVRIVFVYNGADNMPSALYIPDFFEH